MSIYAELNTNPSRRDLLGFGLVVGGAMAALGAYALLHQHRQTLGLSCFAVGAAVFLLSLIPPIGRILYILWMGLGLTMGFFTGPIIMLVLYVLVIVPVGLWFKVVKRDLMRRRLDPDARSYWEEYPRSDDPARYIRQF